MTISLIVGRALVAHPARDVRGEEAPLVAHAVLLCCAHEQLMLLLCPVSHGLRIQGCCLSHDQSICFDGLNAASCRRQ